MQLASFSVRRPVTVVMATVSLVVLGAISFTRIPKESYPSISSSSVSVNVVYPSTSPQELERDVTLPLEQSLALLNNVERISSSSGGNTANVRVEFAAGTDMDLAVMAVRDRVDQARALLPPDVERISLFRWQSDDRPILYADLAWTGDDDRLFDVVRKVVEPRLLRLPGVANVDVRGIQDKQLIVNLDQQRLEGHHVSLGLLAAQLRGNNVDVSIGRVFDAGRRYQARARGEFQRVDEISRLPVPGTGLVLSDLGRVTYDYPERESFSRLNGHDAVTVQVYKASTANTVEVAQAARAELERIAAEQDQLDVDITSDRAEQIMSELNKLKDTSLLGGLLAVGIIFLFLRSIRSTLVIAVAIPVSVACVFTGIYVAREVFDSAITLNMVSMMGLMLAVGMLVDPAVVTLESIFRRRQEEGEEAVAAAVNGTGEVGMAVLASALTTMCVFVPFFFLSAGRVSRWLGDAGLTICLAIGVSTLVSLALIPLASARLFREGMDRFDALLKVLVPALVALAAAVYLRPLGWAGIAAWARGTGDSVAAAAMAMQAGTAVGLGLGALVLAGVAWRCRRRGARASYVQLLTWTLDHRAVTLLAAGALMGLGVWLFMHTEQRGTPWQPERRVDITVETERSFGLEAVDRLFRRIEQDLLAHAAQVDLETLSTRVHRRGGTVTARLVDADAGHLSTMQAAAAIRRRLPRQVGVTYKMGRSRSWAGPELGVEVELRGVDPTVLEVLAEEVKARMAALPGVLSVDTGLEDGEEEIHVSVDRVQALGYGLSPRQVGATIAAALGERRTSSFKAPQREIGIVLQLEEADRASLEQLQNTSFEGRGDGPVQLAALADFDVVEGPQDLKREDRQPTLTVFANTESRKAAYGLTRQVQQLMGTMALPSGYTWQLGRAARWMNQDASQNNFTLLFAVLLIYLIMASLFESLLHPFTIMFAIPFSLIGVTVGLWALDVPLDNNGMLGMLILFGIVVNNGIVLIDHVNQYRRQGLSRRAAILRGGQNRMRPILMTAATTILNLVPLVLPMVYGTAEGFARRWGPVGLVVVSGLATSTVLTLVLAPTLYSLLDDLSIWSRRVVRAAGR